MKNKVILKGKSHDMTVTKPMKIILGLTQPDDWEKRFDAKFHKRIWQLVKMIAPASYVEAEVFGLLNGDGPQIYGEIKDFLRSERSLAFKEGIKKIRKIEKDCTDTTFGTMNYDEFARRVLLYIHCLK